MPSEVDRADLQDNKVGETDGSQNPSPVPNPQDHQGAYGKVHTGHGGDTGTKAQEIGLVGRPEIFLCHRREKLMSVGYAGQIDHLRFERVGALDKLIVKTGSD